MTAFEAFYRDNLRLVLAVALSTTRSTVKAEDLAQETFLRAWRNYSQLRELATSAQRAWLLTTVRNLAADLWRRQALETSAKALAAAAPLPDAPADLSGARSALRLDVLQALSELSPEDQQLVLLRYLQEMNSREIGAALGVPEGTVRRRLARCRALLAQRLAQWAPEGAKS
ncbi:MAG: RNA polymerase sigma factor [Armatimonadota bacterium]